VENGGTVNVHRLREQDGLIRGIIEIAVVVVVVAVVVIDALSLFSAHNNVGRDAGSAALQALQNYVTSSSDIAAEQVARSVLRGKSETLIGFSVIHTPTTVYTVTAQAHADTYVFKLLSHVPGMKKWVHRMLYPKGTGSSQ
jgi:hypothetical protein